MSDAAPLLFLVIALGVFWFLVMRPARTQQRKMQQVQQSLTVGDEVVLSAGIFGTIAGLDDTRAQIEIAPGTVITVARQVVVRRADELAAPGQDVDEVDAADEPIVTDERPDAAPHRDDRA